MSEYTMIFQVLTDTGINYVLQLPAYVITILQFLARWVDPQSVERLSIVPYQFPEPTMHTLIG